MNFDFLHPKEQVSAILQRIYKLGMTTSSGGNVSLRDEEGNIWITPGGVDKGNVTSSDIVYISKAGNIQGLHRPSSELAFHEAIYQARPDIKSVIHAHPPSLVAFSIAKRIPDTRIIPQAYHVCGKVGFAPYKLPGSQALGVSIAQEFEKGANSVIMENHGTVVGAGSLQKAFARLETLEFCAKTEAQTLSIGDIHYLNEKQVNLFRRINQQELPAFDHFHPAEKELEKRALMIKMIKRAYHQKLIISTFGTFSTRMGQDAFLITPTARDRYYLQREDLVYIQNGKKEKGKNPSRTSQVHQQIYRDHPEINSIIFAQSPQAMAYAVARKQLDTRTIPESYVLLRDLPLVPFGNQYLDGKELSGALSKRTPIILIENDSILVTGASIFETFDRLEVAEFSAGSLTQASLMGKLTPMGETEIDELIQQFNL